MTKAQAETFTDQLDVRSMPYSIVMSVDAAGALSWGVQLSNTHVYSGADLTALANYCANHGLQLSATFDQLGVV